MGLQALTLPPISVVSPALPQCGYIAFYKGKQIEVRSPSSYEAQKIAAQFFKAKKSYEVTVILAEKHGQTVTHTPDF